MRATLAAAGLGVLLAAAAAWAQAQELTRVRFHSQLLGREVAYTVYRTDEAVDRTQGSPLVVYLLHGAGADDTSWLRAGAPMPALAEALHHATGRPLVIVMPSLGPDTWWTDGRADRAASAFLKELMPHAESRLAMAAGRRQRALAGVSMGGFGALHLALERPELFCAAALISPAVYVPLPPPDSAARRSPQFRRSGRFDGRLWQAANYPARLAPYRRAAHRVAFWIVSGDHDHLGIALASARLFERLRTMQPDGVELRIIDGGHDAPTFEAAMPAALGYLDQRCR